LLHSYYENIENSKNIKNHSENFEENMINYDSDNDELDDMFNDDLNENMKGNYKNVLNFFNDREVKENEEITKNEGVYTSLKISDFVKEESIFKKKNILEEYLQKIDSKYISKIKIDINICKCPNCNVEMIIYPSDGIQICENCGLQQNILIESDKPSFKDPPMEVCYFSYKRINHYNECIPLSTILIVSYKFLINYKKMIFNLFIKYLLII